MQAIILLARKSGHKIHIDEPELVVEGIHHLCLGGQTVITSKVAYFLL
jgi:hypothetical protein